MGDEGKTKAKVITAEHSESAERNFSWLRAKTKTVKVES